MDNLLFAQKFPFTERARDILREMNISIDDVSEHVIKKSALLVSRAFSNTPYVFDSQNPSKEVLELEVTSFPVAKMFVSVMKTSNMIEKFSMSVFKNTFNNLVESDFTIDLCLELADDFKLNYRITEDKGFIEINLLDYLQIFFVDNESKVVNKQVYNGKVLLNSNDFARFLAEKSYAKVFSSLPISEKNIPKNILTLARSIDSQLVVMEKKSFQFYSYLIDTKKKLKLNAHYKITFFLPIDLNTLKAYKGEKNLVQFFQLILNQKIFFPLPLIVNQYFLQE